MATRRRPRDGAMRTPALPRLLRVAQRFGAVVALAGLVLPALAGAWWRYRSGAGEPSLRLGDRWHEGHVVLDRRGATLRELPSEAGQRGQSLPLEALGDRIIAATLVGEDRDFWGTRGSIARRSSAPSGRTSATAGWSRGRAPSRSSS